MAQLMGELCRRNPLCSLGLVRIQKAHRGALTKTLMDTVPSECLQSPNHLCPREKKHKKFTIFSNDVKSESSHNVIIFFPSSYLPSHGIIRPEKGLLGKRSVLVSCWDDVNVIFRAQRDAILCPQFRSFLGFFFSGFCPEWMNGIECFVGLFWGDRKVRG